MASYTSNYQLHQWVPEDDFLRTDFNEDFQKIDAGIAAALETAEGKAELVVGSFVGDVTVNRVIALGFRPRAVLLEVPDGSRNTSVTEGGLAIRGGALAGARGGTAVSITANGFQVSYIANSSDINAKSTYYYLALK